MFIKIILNEPYPHGKACTNRIHYYAKGLIELNEAVEIIIPRAKRNTEKELLNREIKGVFENVPFIYTPGITVRTKSKLMNKFYDIKGLWRACYYFIRNRKYTDIILLVSNKPTHILVFKFISRIIKAKYLIEKSEIPFKLKKINYLKQLYIRNIFKLFDGFIVISNYLKNYFAEIVPYKAKIIIIPILVNSEEFLNHKNLPAVYTRNIVYTGTLDENKDGALSLIKAFAIVLERIPDAKLIMIGSANHNSDYQKLTKLIEHLNLQNNVILTGYVSRKVMIDYLMNSTALALAKPDNQQSEACFPTKLGEYLMTGKPVVVTRVGEIPIYLKNEVTALIAEPGNNHDFAKKLIRALTNEQDGQIIGSNGKKLAIDEFDYKKNTERLRDFIHSYLSH